MSPIDQLLSSLPLETGDLILFSDHYWITSHVTRVATHSAWTHIGMLVRLETDEFFLFEVSNSPFPILNFLESFESPTIKRSGVRLVRLWDKLRYFPSVGNRVQIAKLRHVPLWNSDQFNCVACQSNVDRSAWMLACMHFMGGVSFRHSLPYFVRAAWKTHQAFSVKSEFDKILPQDFSLGRALGSISNYLDTHGGRLFCTEALVLLLQVLGMVHQGPSIKPAHFVPRDFVQKVLLKKRSKWEAENLDIRSPKLPWTSHWHVEPYLSLHLEHLHSFLHHVDL